MEALYTFIRINVSAGSYLLDFGTNVLTLVEYYKYKHGLLRQSFYYLLMLMFIGHIVAAMVFKMTLPDKHKPLQSAYFLPLMLFWRMLKSSRASWKSSLLELKLMDEATALFGIASLNLETAPSVCIQYSAIYRKRLHDPNFHVSLLLKLSIAAALVSAAFNGGIAVASKAKNTSSRRGKALLRLLAGIHITSALFVRCTIWAVEMLTGVNFLIKLPHFAVVWILHWLVISPGSFSSKWTLRSAGYAVVVAYMSVTISPLYPVVSEAGENDKLGTRFFQLRLAFMVLFVQSIPFTIACILLLRHRYHVPDLIDNAFLLQMGLAQSVSICSALGVIVLDCISGPEVDAVANANPHETPQIATQ